MKPESQTEVGSAFSERLLSIGACDAEAIARAQAVARQEGARLDRVLLRLGLAEESAVLAALCAEHNLARFDSTHAIADRDAIRRLTPSYLTTKLAVPLLANDEGATPIAMADPLESALLSELAFLLERPTFALAATAAELRNLLVQGTDIDSEAGSATRASRDVEELRRADQDGPTIRFVQDMLSEAVHAGASDVHLELSEEVLRLRFRMNGVLVAQQVPPGLNPASVIARLKVLAGLNVAERRLPQDGRLQAVIAGRRVDFRFSSLPTHTGESVVARVLDPRALRLGWEKLGFATDVVDWIQKILTNPSGLFLVTGPTGSGKTTTLYTALSHLNTPGRKIVTVEDPVEYNLPGIQQIQVQEEIGLTFSRVLRGVLRHDPNVIMVGEIRDDETAEIAVRAAQVGRLVLSTLHTNSAVGAVNRLVDLGTPRFLLDDVLRGVLGQELRLVVCLGCGGVGCSACGGSGFVRRELRVEVWGGRV